MGVNFLFGIVVRADFLADVTAVKALCFFDNFGEFWRDFFFVFDCEIRDAEAGIDDSGGDNGAGWALIDAFGALAAEVEFWRFWGIRF